MVWNCYKNALFIIKSAYQLHKSLTDTELSEPSQQTRLHDIWRKLWNLKATNGVKMYMWRACKEVLPTLSNVKNRIIEDNSCPICRMYPEMASHALWE